MPRGIADHIGNRVLAGREIALAEQTKVHHAEDAMRFIVEAAQGVAEIAVVSALGGASEMALQKQNGSELNRRASSKRVRIQPELTPASTGPAQHHRRSDSNGSPRETLADLRGINHDLVSRWDQAHSGLPTAARALV